MIYTYPQSQEHFDKLLVSNAHALLLYGPNGVGLKTIAREYTSPRFIVAPRLLTNSSSVPQIGVEQIRELYELTRGKSNDIRYILIDDADAMTASAQNSFLKLLEEPPENTRFILTSHMPDRLLPTIRSRLQAVLFMPTESANVLLDAVKDASRKKQLMFVASGLPAELTRLIDDEQYFRTIAAEATMARKLMESASYDRLVLISAEKFDRQSALRLLDRCVQFAAISPSKTSIIRTKALLAAYEAIEANGNVRLNLAAAMV